MKFLAAKNLTLTGVSPCIPWEFVPTENITEEIRKNKTARQEWYKLQTTEHCFYSLAEGANPHQRIGRDNPVRCINGFAADYDTVISDERIAEVVKGLKLKPSWVETSIGGHRRLIWLLEAPMLTGDSNEFATLIYQRAEKWLQLQKLPALDEAAWVATSRLFCRGDKWEATGHGPIPVNKSQPFFVDAGKAFRFKSSDGVQIPLDVVEAEIKKKFENFEWPGDFVLASQGPSFWVSGSESVNSAIVKPDGMFTFAGHAEKPFYSWGDILGSDFVKKFAEDTITRATADVWFDGKKYHRKLGERYISMERVEFVMHLQAACRISSKADNSGVSQVTQVLDHIHSHQRIEGAAPFIPKAPGLIIYQKRHYLNTYSGKVIEPATGSHKFGPHGECPWLSMHFLTFLKNQPAGDNLQGWFKYFYVSCLEKVPRPGQTIILAGPPGTGKTLTCREVIGAAVGGFADASSLFIDNSPFNSDLFEVPFWGLDDDSGNSPRSSLAHTHALLKKAVANTDFCVHKKFEVPTMVERAGRMGITINTGDDGMKLIGPMEEGTLQKFSLYQCCSKEERLARGFKFARRDEQLPLIAHELPYFLKALVEWDMPDTVELDPERYGIMAYHEPELFEGSVNVSPAAQFKEILIPVLMSYFSGDPTAEKWTGSAADLSNLIACMSPVQNNRNTTPERVNRGLEQLRKEDSLGLTYETGKHGIRMWTFPKQAIL